MVEPQVCSIIVCEDDPAMTRIFQFLLRQQGIRQVITTASGEHVVDLVRKEHPQLILLDLMLPKKDGLTVLRELKQDESISGVPVIVVSGKEAQEQVHQAMSAGAIDYVIKPFEPAELGARIKSFLQSLDIAPAGDTPNPLAPPRFPPTSGFGGAF
jgi:DNA-binding response OmpR family regulator